MKIVAPKLEQAIAGTTLYLANTEEEIKNSKEAIQEEWRNIYDKMPIMCSICEKVSPRSEFIRDCQKGTCKGAIEEKNGVVIKADTVGGLEALAFELFKLKIPVRQASVGPVNKKTS